jgi:hypothetical protein
MVMNRETMKLERRITEKESRFSHNGRMVIQPLLTESRACLGGYPNSCMNCVPV